MPLTIVANAAHCATTKSSEGDMKKTYIKPEALKRAMLASIAAECTSKGCD